LIADVLTLLPYGTLGLGAIAVLLCAALSGPAAKEGPYWLSLVLLITAAVAMFFGWDNTSHVASAFVVVDTLSRVFGLVFVGGGLSAIVLARHYRPMLADTDEAFHGLILFAVLGMMLLASSANLLTAFLGLELVAIPLFGLIAWQPGRRGAIEGGLKYAVLAGLAAGFFLYGVTLIYAGAGTLNPDQAARVLASDGGIPELVLAGVALIIVGAAFELALVPFHMWAPDIYQASPAPVTALLATVAKMAVLVFLIRLLGIQMPALWQQFLPVLWILALISIVVGNLLALRQENLKRLLAYSSIAHMGYVFMALASGNALGLKAAIYYALAYTVMNMCVFGVVAIVAQDDTDRELLASYRGLGRRHPGLGIGMGVGLLSLAGLPPTAGFFAKLFAFYAALEAGLVALVIVAALGTAASFYYYLRVMVELFATEEAPVAERPVPASAVVVLTASVILTLGLGIFFHLTWGLEAGVPGTS